MHLASDRFSFPTTRLALLVLVASWGIVASACGESHAPGGDAGASDGRAVDATGADAATEDGGALCAGDFGACEISDDCCNRRHACFGGYCRYSCARPTGFCLVDGDCCDYYPGVCVDNVCR